MKPAELPELDTTGLSAKAHAAITAITPTKRSNDAARSVTTLAGALAPADVAILTKAFETTAKAFARFARTPTWQKPPAAPRRNLLWLLKHVACVLRTKDPARMVAFVIGLPASWPRTELFEVLTGLYDARPIGQKELAKLVDVRSLDRMDLYVAFEALYATDQKQLRAVVRRPAKTWQEKKALDVACDVIESESTSLARWLPDFYPHVVTVDEVRHVVETNAKDFVRYLTWAQKHVDRKTLAKYLRARLPQLVYVDRAWTATVKPKLAAVANKLDDAKLASLVSNLDLD